MKLPPGVTAFLGPNGSGKSNAVKAIPFALVGSLEDGTKAENVSQLADNPTQSLVEVEFLHGDFRAVVKRYLKGGQTSITLFNAAGVEIESVKGDTKTTERVLALLGTTQQVLSDYVFVGQEELFAPFSAKTRPADRAVAFQKLFGLSRAEECWAVIGTKLATTPEITPPDVASIEAEKAALVEALTVEAGKVSRLEHLRNWSEPDEDSAVLDCRRKANEAAAKRPEAESRKLQGAARIVELSNKLEGYRSQYELLSKAITAAESREEESKGRLSQRVSAQSYAARRTPLAEALTRAEAELERLGKPPVLEVTWTGPAEVTDVRAEIEKTAIKLAEADGLLKTFEDGATVCPTCKRKSDDGLAASVRQAKVDKPRLEAQLASYRKYAAAVEAHQLKATSYADSELRARASLNAAKKALADFDMATPPVFDVPEADWQAASALLASIQTWRSGRDNVQALSNVLQPELAAAHTTQAQLVAAEEELLRQIQANPSEAAYATALQSLEAKRKAKTELAVAEAAVVRLTADIAAVNLRLAGAMAIVVSAQKTRKIREKLNSIRTVLHRDNLPSLAAKRYLDALAYDTNDILSMFNAEFRLQSEDGLSYRANFFDGRNQPLVRLSGGQRVITALAFRIAINARFAKDLGMLCLDEPTAYLDSDNIGCLDLALGKLHQLSQSRSLQCILITHEAVGHLVDHVETFNPRR